MNTDPELNDVLWRLLGKAKQPAVSPFFARNVLRAVREEQTSVRRSASLWLHWSWRVVLAGACATVIFSFVKLPHRAVEKRETSGMLARQIVSSPDYEVITHLDELAANEENSLWLDDSIN